VANRPQIGQVLRLRPRAVWPAKCIVLDDARLFVTSANFTEAAPERSIEAGLLIDDPSLAGRSAPSSMRSWGPAC
jgi:phosphatidylserine/phosphatidylglycerophosphate/cardiolipin synthase-like enzyme